MEIRNVTFSFYLGKNMFFFSLRLGEGVNTSNYRLTCIPTALLHPSRLYTNISRDSHRIMDICIRCLNLCVRMEESCACSLVQGGRYNKRSQG